MWLQEDQVPELNPKGPRAIPVSHPEEILRRARALLWQTSSAAQKATSCISRNFSAIISSAETLNSQEFINTSENPRVWASSSTTEDPSPGDSIGISIPPPPSQQVPSSVLPSSTLSIPIFKMATPQLTKMERITVARYAPLNFPNPLSAMPIGDYIKYMPNFIG